MPSQFIVGKDRESVAQAVKALGWRKAGRASWVKPDGTEVHYLHFVEQIASATAGDTANGDPLSLETLEGSQNELEKAHYPCAPRNCFLLREKLAHTYEQQAALALWGHWRGVHQRQEAGGAVGVGNLLS